MLIGDERQLAVANNIRFPELDPSNTTVSMFERMLHLKQVPQVMLVTQYRMHESICKPVSAVIYDHRLQTIPEVNQQRHCKKLTFLHPTPEVRSQVIWMDSSKTHEVVTKDGVSYVNRQEAEIARKVIVGLLRQDAEESATTRRPVMPKDIGIITFYRAQKTYLKEVLAEFVDEVNRWRFVFVTQCLNVEKFSWKKMKNKENLPHFQRK